MVLQARLDVDPLLRDESRSFHVEHPERTQLAGRAPIVDRKSTAPHVVTCHRLVPVPVEYSLDIPRQSRYQLAPSVYRGRERELECIADRLRGIVWSSIKEMMMENDRHEVTRWREPRGLYRIIDVLLREHPVRDERHRVKWLGRITADEVQLRSRHHVYPDPIA